MSGLLPTTLELALRNLRPMSHLHIVTPNPSAVRALVGAMPEVQRSRTSVWSDAQVCPEAVGLDPWFRQQYIKLHADRLAATRHVACLGADTLVLDHVYERDLVGVDGRPILRYFRYLHPNAHLRFERKRVRNVARLLQVEPRRAYVLGDFICDLFVFNVETLQALRKHLEARRDGLHASLASLGHRQGFDDRFGEWTAYAVFMLDISSDVATILLDTGTFFRQVHSAHDLAQPDRYSAKVVHFAWTPPDVSYVLNDLHKSGRLPVVHG